MILNDRDNYEHSNRWVIITVQVLAVVTQNSPDACKPKDIAEILSIPTDEVEEILINLCIEEIVRETEYGFQTIGRSLEKLSDTSHQTMDDYFSGGLNLPVPKSRDAQGRWIC